MPLSTPKLPAVSPPSDDLRGVLTPPGKGSGRAPLDLTGPVVDRIQEFRVLGSLGSGGMGTVFRGHDTLLDRPVAIKLLRVDEAFRETQAAHLNEARAAARVQHPNVAAVYRVGQLDGQPFIVSELVSGVSLDKLKKPLPWREALGLAIGLSRGLAAAHRRGVLHGDLKPANAILADDGTVKLVDFGLAQLIDVDAARGEIDASAILGTPNYMAPEAWTTRALSRRSDVYSMGALLFELLTGQPPFFGKAPHQIAALAMRGQVPALSSVVADIDLRFADILDRCLQRLPEGRFASAEELRDALEDLDDRSRGGAIPEGNPYRGLLAFEAAHSALFFGRDSEIGTILERLRTDPFVLVAGDSGTGKSSLCRAGVLPRVAAGALEGDSSDRRVYRAVQLVPGRRPAQSLAAALAPEIAQNEDTLYRILLDHPEEIRATILRALGPRRGLVVFIDQLEELLTIGQPDESAAVAEAIGRHALRTPGVRFLMSIRSDFLARATVLPGLGDELTTGLYLLRPLSAEKMRQAIVGPARSKGVSFESDALVESLIASTGRAEGGLPLLQFALSELWEAKDPTSTVITARSLDEIGGVEGALARHANHVLHRLPPPQQTAARRMLCSLVTLERTRARRMGDELTRDDPNAKAALDALVKGRLLVAGEGEGGGAIEIAHEALVTGWFTLRRMLDEQAEARAVVDRLEKATTDWKRLGKKPDLLWGKAQLDEATRVDPDLIGASERQFLEASRREVLQRRRLRAGLLLLVPVVLVSMYGAARLSARREMAQRLAQYEREATTALDDAVSKEGEVRAVERRAFDAFDHMHRDEGERLWAEARLRNVAIDARYREAAQKIEAALDLDLDRDAMRETLARVLYLRTLLAERRHQPALVEELSQRLEVYDTTGAMRAKLRAPAALSIVADAEGSAATISIAAYRAAPESQAELEAPRVLGASSVTVNDLAPASYLIEATAPGRPSVRLPILLRRGESAQVRLPIPRAERIPEGFVFVPAGRFLFGSSDDESVRRSFLTTIPTHTVTTDAYLIARHETTFGEWIDYLKSLPKPDRQRRLQGVGAGDFTGSLHVVELETGDFEITLKPTTTSFTARSGEPVVYASRAKGRNQLWLKMPVLGLAHDDIEEYMIWLDRSGRVGGARFCTDHEWERAARGADDRLYPHGWALAPEDANFYETYGKDPAAVGPDEVGTHPRSVSPFGVEDMAGNAFEWVQSSLTAGEWVLRGGSYFFDSVSTRSANRNAVDANYRDPRLGFRVCAPINFP